MYIFKSELTSCPEPAASRPFSDHWLVISWEKRLRSF